MRLQGKVTHWNDDKGFGFVEPNGGGKRAFVHIKAFGRYSRRPVNGEEISYDLLQGIDNRYTAENIKFAGESPVSLRRIKEKLATFFGICFIFAFAVTVLASVIFGKLPSFILVLYAVMSLFTFVAYAIDKGAAERGRWRTKESTLHVFALLGGWPGAYFAQVSLRHKSSKSEFKQLFWATVLLNIGGLFWLHTDTGASLLKLVLPKLLSI